MKHGGGPGFAARILEAQCQVLVQYAGNYLGSQELTIGPKERFSGTFIVKIGATSYSVTYTTPADGAVIYTITETNESGVPWYEYVIILKKGQSRPSIQKAPNSATTSYTNSGSDSNLAAAAAAMMGFALLGGFLSTYQNKVLCFN